MTVDLSQFLPLAIVTLVAAAVQGLAGFGFALIALPVFMWVLGSRDAVPMVIIVNLAICALLAIRLREAVARPLLLRLCAGAALGLPPGLYLFRRAAVEQLMIAVGVVLVVLVGVVAVRESLGAEPDGDPTFRSVSATGMGAVAGGMAIALGMPGPVTLYLTALRLSKDVFRATTLAFFVAAYCASLLLQSLTGSVPWEVWRSSVLLLPVAAVGGFIGHRLCGYVDERTFRRGVLAMLVVIGAASLIQGLIS